MKNYVIADEMTGRVISSGVCANTAILPAGAVLTEHYCPGFFGYVDNGKLIAVMRHESPYYEFDWVEKQWFDPRTLDDLRAAKWELIKQDRSTAEYGGFTWDGSTFDSDAISQARIQGAVQLAGIAPSFEIDWTLADNTVRTLSAADIAAVAQALGQHVAVQFSRARYLREQIMAAASPEAVHAITWTSNV